MVHEHFPCMLYRHVGTAGEEFVICQDAQEEATARGLGWHHYTEPPPSQPTTQEGSAMAKEKGMSKSASPKAKAYDEKHDKAKGLKEGSAADRKADKAAMKRFPAKKGR